MYIHVQTTHTLHVIYWLRIFNQCCISDSMVVLSMVMVVVC